MKLARNRASFTLHSERCLYSVGSVGKTAKVEARSAKRYPENQEAGELTDDYQHEAGPKISARPFLGNAGPRFATVKRMEKSVGTARISSNSRLWTGDPLPLERFGRYLQWPSSVRSDRVGAYIVVAAWP